MLTSSLGHVSVTEVDGTTFTGLYAADGSLNVYDATSDTVPNGLYHPCGAMNITITDGTTLTGRYANNGSIYVVIDSTQYGVYHSCGAMNVTGLVVSLAEELLGSETDGLAFVAEDMTFVVRDTATPANNFSGDPNDGLVYNAPFTKYILNSLGVYEAGTTIRPEYNTNLVDVLGIRVEEARTNIVANSTTFSLAMSKANVTVTSDSITAPDNSVNGDLLAFLDNGYLYTVNVVQSAGTRNYTASIFLKGTPGETVGLRMANSNTGVGNGILVNLTSNWTKYSVTSNITITGTQSVSLGLETRNGVVAGSGGAANVYIWNTQIEVAANASSPIITAGTSVTRAVDDIKILLTDFPWNGGTGTLEVDGIVTTPTTSGGYLIIQPRSGETHVSTFKWVPA